MIVPPKPKTIEIQTIEEEDVNILDDEPTAPLELNNSTLLSTVKIEPTAQTITPLFGMTPPQLEVIQPSSPEVTRPLPLETSQHPPIETSEPLSLPKTVLPPVASLVPAEDDIDEFRVNHYHKPTTPSSPKRKVENSTIINPNVQPEIKKQKTDEVIDNDNIILL